MVSYAPAGGLAIICLTFSALRGLALACRTLAAVVGSSRTLKTSPSPPRPSRLPSCTTLPSWVVKRGDGAWGCGGASDGSVGRGDGTFGLGRRGVCDRLPLVGIADHRQALVVVP